MMDTNAFAQRMSQLSEAFDDPGMRQKPLNERAPITEALERDLYQLIDLTAADGFIEIGAYEAAFSQDMKKKYPTADVVAVEANPRVYATFSEKVTRSGVRYVAKAVGETPGMATFHIPEVIAGSRMPYAGRMGSLHQVGLRDSETTSVDVEVTTLDQLSEDVSGSRLCLWVDVEGALSQVLAGGSSTLQRTAVLYCETETSTVWKGQTLAKDVTAALRDKGFVPIARDCQKWFQHNLLCVRADLLDAPIDALAQRFCDEALALFKA